MLRLFAHCLSLSAFSGKGVEQRWWTYGESAKTGMQKDFLGTWHSLLYQYFFISSARPASLYFEEYIYTYLTAYRLYMNYRRYQTTLQWNIFTQIGALRSVDWIFIVGAPAWRWLGEYVTLGRTLNSPLLKQEAVAAPVTATCSCLSHSSRTPLLEV
jgi:hypothetical protein